MLKKLKTIIPLLFVDKSFSKKIRDKKHGILEIGTLDFFRIEFGRTNWYKTKTRKALPFRRTFVQRTKINCTYTHLSISNNNEMVLLTSKKVGFLYVLCISCCYRYRTQSKVMHDNQIFQLHCAFGCPLRKDLLNQLNGFFFVVVRNIVVQHGQICRFKMFLFINWTLFN